MKKLLFIILLFAANAGYLSAQSMPSTERDSLYQVIDDLSNRVKAAEHQLEYISMVQDLSNQLQSFKIFSLDLKMMGADILAELRNNTLAERFDQYKRNYDATKKLFNSMMTNAGLSVYNTEGFSEVEKNKVERLRKDFDTQIEFITTTMKILESTLADIEKIL